MKKFRSSLLLAGVVVALGSVAPGAAAAPVTVQLRIEGPTTTLFEGPVTTDTRAFQFTGDPTSHTCDGTSAIGGSSPTPVPTRGAVVMAAKDVGLTFTGSWFNGLGASFATINGVNVDFDPSTNEFLVEYHNGQSDTVGACARQVHTGDSEVFAYNDGSQDLLGLTGPATVAPGDTAKLKVVDLAGNTAVSGATVDGHLSDGTGSVTVGPYAAGDHPLKATKTGFVRSNAIDVCATTGSDGFCGTTKPTPTTTTATTTTPATTPTTATSTTSAPPPTTTTTSPVVSASVPDTTPPVATIASIGDGKTFAKGHGPRTLAGTADDPGSGIDHVSLRLIRTSHRHCSTFLPSKAKFEGIRCGAAHGVWFKVGSSAAWSYLLPAVLPSGSYTLDVRVTDRSHNYTTALDSGKEHVAFTVR